MNKRYIDFVPNTAAPKKRRTTSGSSPEVSFPSTTPRVTVTTTSVTLVKDEDVNVEAIFAERPVEKSLEEPKPAIGSIENLSEKFVNTKVEKRPLSRSSFTSAAAAKAKKIPKIPLIGKKKNTDSAPEPSVKKEEKKPDTLTVPSSPFVRSVKVAKRPLSRNVYRPEKPVTEPKEPKGTVTIIEKPEKDSRIGLIVTIIITLNWTAR